MITNVQKYYKVFMKKKFIVKKIRKFIKIIKNYQR